MNRLWNKLLDKSIFFSFDKSGFIRHQKNFNHKLKKESLGTTLITGGTSGIGEAVADFLLGDDVIVIGRSENKFTKKQNRSFIQLDVSNWDDIVKVVDDLPKIQNLVLNAGAMPDTYKTNDYGVETQCASQLLGHLVLFHQLRLRKKLEQNAKVIITSSGGMLLKKLNLDTLFKTSDYDKVATYANVKRAQVIINFTLSKIYPEYQFACMHPGWVETTAVKEALPGFYEKMGQRLRTPAMGADTINYLICEDFVSGKFWFDREINSPHLCFLTKESSEIRADLESQINEIIKDFV